MKYFLFAVLVLGLAAIPCRAADTVVDYDAAFLANETTSKALLEASTRLKAEVQTLRAELAVVRAELEAARQRLAAAEADKAAAVKLAAEKAVTDLKAKIAAL